MEQHDDNSAIVASGTCSLDEDLESVIRKIMEDVKEGIEEHEAEE